MTNHLFTRSGGIWAPGTGLLSAELADLDAKTVDSISATGGVYSIQSDLVIGGDPGMIVEFAIDVHCDSDLTVGESLIVTEDIHCFGEIETQQLQVNFETTLDGTVTVGGDATFNGITTLDVVSVNDQLFVNSTSGFYDNVFFEVGSDPEFNAPTTFNQDVTINDVLDANANCFLGGTGFVVELLAPTTLRQPMTMQGSGAIAFRVVAGNDTDTVFSPLAVREVIMDAGVLTGSTDFYIDDAGCGNGNEILFANKDPAAEIAIRRPGGELIKRLTNAWGRFVRRAGVWELAQLGDF